MLRSKRELSAFVAALRIPESRKRVVEAELLDHVESRIAAALAAGRGADEAEREALAALGEAGPLRASLERVEPAFALDPVRASLRGLASALAASMVFVVAGALFRRGYDQVDYLVVALPAAIVGLVVVWITAPRGIGTAVRVELRACSEPGRPLLVRPSAASAWLVGLIIVPYAVWPAWALGLLSAVARDEVLWPTSLLGLAYGFHALGVMRRARAERALVRAERA